MELYYANIAWTRARGENVEEMNTDNDRIKRWNGCTMKIYSETISKGTVCANSAHTDLWEGEGGNEPLYSERSVQPKEI